MTTTTSCLCLDFFFFFLESFLWWRDQFGLNFPFWKRVVKAEQAVTCRSEVSVVKDGSVYGLWVQQASRDWARAEVVSKG